MEGQAAHTAQSILNAALVDSAAPLAPVPGLARDMRFWLMSGIALVGAVVLAAALVWQGADAAARERAANHWHAHTLEVLVEAGEFTTAVSETQRGARGYLLTHDPKFLTTYRLGLRETPVRLQRMRTLTADNPAQQKRVSALGTDAALVATLSEREVELEAAGQHEAARAIVKSRTANDAMRRVMKTSAAIVGEEQRLLHDRRTVATSESARSATISLALGIFGAILLFVAAGLGWVAFAAATRARLFEVQAKAQERTAATAALLSQFIVEAPAAIAMFDREMRYLAVSRRFSADYGLDPRTELVGRSHYEIFPEIPQRWRGIHQRVLAGGSESCEEDPFPRADGRTDWVHWRMAPWRNAEGEVAGALLFSEVVTEKVEVRRAHAAAEARLRAIVETAVDAIVVIDERGVIQSANPATQAMFGYAADELVGRNVAVLMPEPDCSAHDRYLAAYLKTGERKILGTGREVTGLRKDGSRLPLDLAVAEWCADGRRCFTGLMRDATTRKVAEAQRLQAESRELVVGELRHRMNNMFAVISGLVRATARSHRDVDACRDALLARIASFAATQVTLARQGWSSMRLRELLEFELQPYLDEGRKVVFEGEDLRLSPEGAQNVAMIAHELATNAAKYGALSSFDALLRVHWKVVGDAGRQRVEFRWIERGGPLVTTPRRSGFGATVINSSACALGGSAKLEFDPEGLNCTIDMAAARALATSHAKEPA